MTFRYSRAYPQRITLYKTLMKWKSQALVWLQVVRNYASHTYEKIKCFDHFFYLMPQRSKHIKIILLEVKLFKLRRTKN